MTNLEPYITEVSEAVKQGRAAFMVGAGVSIGRQSYLPGWETLVRQFLLIISNNDEEIIDYISEYHMGLLFNEVILQRMVEAVGVEQTSAGIKACMNTDSYSAIHKFLAWAISRFDNLVLTTNYDELIERAGDSDSSIIKLHGTLSDIEHARFMVNQLYTPLEDSFVTKARALNLSDRLLVVIGYRGADEFDVLPFLFQDSPPKRMLWLVHNDVDSIDPGARSCLHEHGWPYLQADADEFLRSVYEKTKDFSSADPELDSWHPSHAGNSIGWWLDHLNAWGRDLRDERREDLELLWARILDYLRVNEIKTVSSVRKAAEESYLIVKKSSDPKRILEADAHIAYIRRTAQGAPPKEIVVAFQQTIHEIWLALDAAQQEDERRTLQELLAWTTHQFGVTLQNLGAHPAAMAVLDEAANLRRFIGDLQLPYTHFQQFINGVLASINGLGQVDEFAPRGWRTQLIPALDRYAELFHQEHQPEHHGNTIHNIAYVHQFLAREHEQHNRFDEAIKEFEAALKLDEDAKRIRERLRDPRMIVQSDVRIAECKLGLARQMCRDGRLEKALSLIDHAQCLAVRVEETYQRMSQESFRFGDVKEILNEVESLKQEHHL